MSFLSGRWCSCEYAQAKQAIWQAVICHLDGCNIQMLVWATGQPPDVILWCLEELHVEEKVYPDRGRWYPEMGVS